MAGQVGDQVPLAGVARLCGGLARWISETGIHSYAFSAPELVLSIGCRAFLNRLPPTNTTR